MDSGCSRTRLTLTTSTRNTRVARLAESIATHTRVATSSHDQITMRNSGGTGIRRSHFRLTRREQLYPPANPFPPPATRKDVGPHFAGPDHERSGKTKAGAVRRCDGG